MKLMILESLNIHDEYVFITTKQVPDFDGFMTDYTMYQHIVADTEEWYKFLTSDRAEIMDIPDKFIDGYVFVFGDTDLYDPNEDPVSFDYECDTEEEAYEWFDDYNGFEDDKDY